MPETIGELYTQKVPVREIIEMLGVSRRKVYLVLHAEGIALHGRIGVQRRQFQSAKPVADVPNCIYSLRAYRNISSTALARKVGCKASAIRRAERGGGGLGVANWNKTAKELGVRPCDLHNPDFVTEVLQKNPA